MNKFAILFFLLAIISCGEGQDREQVLTGRFFVETTVVSISGSSDTPCSSTQDIGQITDSIWIIEKNGDNYRVLIEDFEGRQYHYADSFDGYSFYGSEGASVYGCFINIDWQIDLEYSSDGFVGTVSDTLSMSCENGNCVQRSELQGVLQ